MTESQHAGYDLTYKRTYAKEVTIAEGVESMRVPDFEIEQLAPRHILVTDTDNQPIEGARVVAYQRAWLDERIVIWSSFSPTQTTDATGTCMLDHYNTAWTTGAIWASHESDGQTWTARAEISPTNNQFTHLQLRPPIRIHGVLAKNGQPAASVGVVLYETVDAEHLPRGWATIGVRGEIETDSAGRYEFSVAPGLQYAVALRERNAEGHQAVLHRMKQHAEETTYRIPNLDLDLQRR